MQILLRYWIWCMKKLPSESEMNVWEETYYNGSVE